MEEYISEADGLSFIDDVGCVVTGTDVNHVDTILARCPANSIEWGSRRGQQFDTAKTEAALFSSRWGHRKHHQRKLTAKIRVGNWIIPFNTYSGGWGGIWMDTHLKFKEQHHGCMKKAWAAEATLRALNKTYVVVPESLWAGLVSGAQAVALFGIELWWDPTEVGRGDDVHLLLNRQARSILGALPITTQGA